MRLSGSPLRVEQYFVVRVLPIPPRESLRNESVVHVHRLVADAHKHPAQRPLVLVRAGRSHSHRLAEDQLAQCLLGFNAEWLAFLGRVGAFQTDLDLLPVDKDGQSVTVCDRDDLTDEACPRRNLLRDV